MKILLFVAMLLVSVQFSAQHSGGRRGGSSGQGQESTSREVKEFKASDVVGIFYYDESEIIKKLKVKDKDKQYLVKKELSNYNTNVREISFLNSEKFSDLNVVINATRNSGDRESGSKMREKVEEIVKPVKEEVLVHEEELNRKLENILSEKQLKKWIKYQKNKKESLQPKQPQNKNAGSRSNTNRGGGLRN
jgi:hypothetical protein